MSDYMKYDGRKPEPPYLTPMDYDSLVAQNECLAAELAEAKESLSKWKQIADDRRTRGMAAEIERDALIVRAEKAERDWYEYKSEFDVKFKTVVRERDQAISDLNESRKVSKLWEQETYQRIAERDALQEQIAEMIELRRVGQL